MRPSPKLPIHRDPPQFAETVGSLDDAPGSVELAVLGETPKLAAVSAQGAGWFQLCSARHYTRRWKGVSAVRFAPVLRKCK
jgi:hypothetical protein